MLLGVPTKRIQFRPFRAGELAVNGRRWTSTPARYEIRVAGHLDQRWSAWFGGMAITLEDDGTTTLVGSVADQAALHGLLARMRDIGAPLISINAAASAR